MIMHDGVIVTGIEDNGFAPCFCSMHRSLEELPSLSVYFAGKA